MIIDENEAQRGIIGMLDRGVIPRAAQLTLEPSPIRHERVALHGRETFARDRFEQSARRELTYS